MDTKCNITKSYKFNENLLKLSSHDNLNDAINEWYLIDTIKTETNDNICICQHKVKNLNYMYNIITKHTIICGVTCCKKFKLKSKEIKNNILLQILKTQIKGEYCIINNVLEYSESIKNKLIQYFNEKINENIETLKDLLNDINNLIITYHMDYLDEVKQNILLHIDKIEIEKQKLIEIEKQKLIKIEKQKNKENLEKIVNSILKEKAIHKEKKRLEKKEKNRLEKKKYEIENNKLYIEKQNKIENEIQSKYEIEKQKDFILYDEYNIKNDIENYKKLILDEKTNYRINNIINNYTDKLKDKRISCQDKEILTNKIKNILNINQSI